jgi:hypothetical protein
MSFPALVMDVFSLSSEGAFAPDGGPVVFKMGSYQ